MERCRPIIKAKNRRFNRRYLGIGRLAATRGLGELLKSYIAGEDRPGALKLSPSRFSRCEPILFRCYVPLPSIMRWFILDNLSLRWEKEGGFVLRKTKKKERKRTKKNCFSNIYIYPRSVLFEKSRNKRYSYSIFDIFREFTNVKKKRESSSIHFFHFSSQTFSPISFYVCIYTLSSFSLRSLFPRCSMEKNLSSRYSYSCSVFK